MFCTVWLIQFWNINTVHCSLNKKKNQGSVFLKILFRFKVVNSPISELSFLSECRYFDYKLIFTLWHSPPPPFQDKMCIVINFHGSYVLMISN